MRCQLETMWWRDLRRRAPELICEKLANQCCSAMAVIERAGVRLIGDGNDLRLLGGGAGAETVMVMDFVKLTCSGHSAYTAQKPSMNSNPVLKPNNEHRLDKQTNRPSDLNARGDKSWNHTTYTHINSQLSSLVPLVTPEVPNPLKVGLDLNATANGSQESASRNAETGGTQNGQPNPNDNNPGGRRSTSAFDRLGPGQPEPRLFGGIGSDDTQIMQDLRHRMQAMELEVKELRKENIELKNVAQDLRARRRSPLRRRERSRSRSPSQRRLRTPPQRRRCQNSSESPDSSSDESREGRRRRPHRYKRIRNRDGTPPVDGHTHLSSWILTSTSMILSTE
ncbi:hypothetical protein PIB30_020293 [Stylosanthes scabra]|uniref:Uncharacterized protein n=1 Tax=Stylosanthes scabra TaxID=79078 RepID=A0ABU6VAR5_9FABA|nr:hypothetical protein [Stylosanthes scabra]